MSGSGSAASSASFTSIVSMITSPATKSRIGAEEVHQAGAEELADGRDVVRDAGHQVAGLVVVEEFLVEATACVHTRRCAGRIQSGGRSR